MVTCDETEFLLFGVNLHTELYIYVYVCIYHVTYHIISYHIISYHFISYHFISLHIISYHFISYHIISYLALQQGGPPAPWATKELRPLLRTPLPVSVDGDATNYICI